MTATLPPLDAAELRRLVDDLTVGVLVQGPRSEIRYVNRRALELFGMTAEQLVGQSVLDPQWSVVDASGREVPGEELPAIEALRTGRSTGDVVLGVRGTKQSERVWLLVRADPTLDAAGRVMHVILTFTDITALRRAEERRELAMREAERFRAALDEVPAFVYIKDRESRYQYANAPTLRLFGVDAAELPGSTDRRFFPEDAAARLREVDLRVLAGERTHETIVIREPTGERIYLEVKSPLAADPQTGEIPGLLGISIDITERRHLEDVYRTSQRLEAVGRLAGGIAHDFNNMLGVILGHAELALASGGDGPLRESLEEIYAAARRSADLTRQLLAFARKQPTTPVALSIGAHAAAAAKLLRRLVSEDVQLRVEPDEGDWAARVDPSHLDQVLANLCVNAGDAIRSRRNAAAPAADRPRDEIIIRTAQCVVPVALAQQHGALPGDYVQLSVSDTGPGIPDDVRERMFEPFFTTKPVGEGTGLGLATVFGIVSQSEGFITVDTSDAGGATFRLHFPRIAARGDAVAEATGVGTPRGGGETIFVVEDEPQVLQLAVRALSALGYRVFSATDGASALRIAAAHHGAIDLVLTDLVMPGMNGRELATALQARYPGLRVLYMSGYSAEVLGGDDTTLGGIDLLAKPFTIQELAVRVRTALAR